MNLSRISWCLLLAGVVFSCAGFGSHDGEEAAANPSAFATPNQITHDGLYKAAVLSDGTALYVAERKGQHQILSKIVPETGAQSTIHLPFSDVRALDISPDQKSLLASTRRAGSSSRELWTIQLSGMMPSRLGELGADDASWSPSGEELVSVKGHEIWISSATGTNRRKLAEVNGHPFAPRFSPDGQKIRFSASDLDKNTSALWEVNKDGSNLHEMLVGWNKGSAVCCGVWSKDGKQYIFQTTVSWPTTITMLWALPGTEEGEPKQLTKGPMSFGSPWPAADSGKIWALGVSPRAQVVKYDPQQKKFSRVLSGISATDLDYSPDGKWVTYVSIPDLKLCRSRVDGSDRIELTSGPERVALPHWSPDSKQIAYVSVRTGEPSRIMLVGVDGGNATPMHAEDRGQNDANWSADGKRIIYGRQFAPSGNMGIFVLDLKTGKVTELPHSQGLFSPRLSPDERYIVALSRDLSSLKLFDFRTGQWTLWFREAAGSVGYPVWSKDSKYLYFDDMVTDEESIRRVKLGEDHAESVFAVRGVEHYLGQFGYWSGQAPDGSWMFLQDRSTQEVYSLDLEASK